MSYPTPDDMSDAEFIERPALWPLRDSLPLKRWSAEPEPPELGFLLRESRSEGWEVHRRGDASLRYETVDDLIRDGWVVD